MKKKKHWLSSENLIDEINNVSIEDLQNYASMEGHRMAESILVDDILPSQTEKEEQVELTNEIIDNNESVNIGVEGINDSFSEEKEIEIVKKPIKLAREKEVENSLYEAKNEENKAQEASLQKLTMAMKSLIDENEKLLAYKLFFEENQVTIAENQNDLNEIQSVLEIAQQTIQALASKIKESTQIHQQKEEAWIHERRESQQYQAEQQEQLKKNNLEIDALKKSLLDQTSQLDQNDPQPRESTEEQHDLLAIISDLRKENAELQEEISEVLIFARRKANRTLEGAKIESERILCAAEARIETIQERAKQIVSELKEVRGNVDDLFDDLNDQINQLSDKKIFFEDVNNGI
ncbi:hypothetical protein [Enterococcus sp.]|uniref:hypothetical protein n=1 Tax=Enterococcus sp. TaxID=35783 RepID=UPI0028A08942|nr:hypothetical protein [Enterococcus sp.]